MSNDLSGVWLQKIWQMLGIKNPGGPPIPRKELIKLLRRLRKLIDEGIVKLEGPAAKPAARAKAKPKAKPKAARSR